MPPSSRNTFTTDSIDLHGQSITVIDEVEEEPSIVTPAILNSVRQRELSARADLSEDERRIYFAQEGQWYSVAVDQLQALVEGESDSGSSQPSVTKRLLFGQVKLVQRDKFVNLPAKMGMKFTGEGGVRVKEFLKWMDSWFATMGDDWTGGTSKSKTMRVGQIHVACPIHSAAGKFIGELDNDVYWDEELLRQALISQFHDAEREEHLDEDILSSMSTLRQGSQDVFKYSGKVLKLLQRQPSGSRHYDRILVGYYLDGLRSKRLRELAVLAFRKRDSRETPSHVVKEVMRLATELKVKGYRTHGGRNSDDDDDDEDDDEDSEDSDAESSDDDDDDDDNDGYGHGRKKRRARKTAKNKGLNKKKGKKSKSKERKARKGQAEEATSSGEVQELREMMRELMQLQKTTLASGTGAAAGHTEADVIPLDSYAVGDRYGRRPYDEPDSNYSTTRGPEYANRRSQASQSSEFRQSRRWGYLASGDDCSQEPGRGGPPTRSYVEGFARRPTEGLRYAQPTVQPTGNHPPSRPYENSSAPPPIVGPNGVLYYPARPRVCFYCQEEGHLRSQCPQLRTVASRTVVLGPEHPDTLAQPREEPSERVRDKSVNVVEVVARSSALVGMKVREVTATTVEDPDDLKKFVCKIEKVDEGDDLDSDGTDSEWEEEEEEGVPVMAGERARRFSELPPEFDGEEGPASRRRRTQEDDDDAATVGQGTRNLKSAASKVLRKPTRMMAGREKFDFVGAFRDAPVTGLNWGSFFDLAPSVKKDICHLLVQERTKSLAKGKGKGRGKGKKVTIDAGVGSGPEEEEVLAVATDRDLGDVANFYTKGTIRTGEGEFRVKRILVDAGSVVNLMPIHLLRFIGANLRKAGGMVIRTATNALAKIAYCADVRITIADVACDLRVYALPDEYKPTYPLLLSRRWLQAVKAKGDYASGQYFIMQSHGSRVRIPRDRSAQISPQRHRPRVPVVMRDRDEAKREVSDEIEEELEWQRSGGNRFFENLVELIKRQAKEQMRYDNEAEDGELSDDSEN